jgi:hypothetical protein
MKRSNTTPSPESKTEQNVAGLEEKVDSNTENDQMTQDDPQKPKQLFNDASEKKPPAKETKNVEKLQVNEKSDVENVKAFEKEEEKSSVGHPNTKSTASESTKSTNEGKIDTNSRTSIQNTMSSVTNSIEQPVNQYSGMKLPTQPISNQQYQNQVPEYQPVLANGMYGPYGNHRNPQPSIVTAYETIPASVVNTMLQIQRQEAINQMGMAIEQIMNVTDPWSRLNNILYDRDQYWMSTINDVVVKSVDAAMRLHKEASLVSVPKSHHRRTRSMTDISDIEEIKIARIQLPMKRSAEFNPVKESGEMETPNSKVTDQTMYGTPSEGDGKSNAIDSSYSGPLKQMVEGTLNEMEQQKLAWDRETQCEFSPVKKQMDETVESITKAEVDQLRNELDSDNQAEERNWDSVLNNSTEMKEIVEFNNQQTDQENSEDAHLTSGNGNSSQSNHLHEQLQEQNEAESTDASPPIAERLRRRKEEEASRKPQLEEQTKPTDTPKKSQTKKLINRLTGRDKI